MKSPKIEFPCDYPIKIIGRRTTDFESVVLEVVGKFAPGYDAERISLKESGKGNYCSLTVWIMANSEEQLSDMFQALKKISQVTMVL